MGSTLSASQKIDIVEELYYAQEKLQEVVAAVGAYVNASGDKNTGAYMLDKLKIMASSGHGFLCGDLNMDEVIRRAEAWSREGEDNGEGE